VRRLHAGRPRNRFVRGSLVVMVVLVTVCWTAGGFRPQDWLAPHRLANLRRFLADLQPWPVRQEGGGVGEALGWAAGLWRDGGADATSATLAVSLVAIVLAGVVALLSTVPAAGNLATPAPYLPGGRLPGRMERWAWFALVGAARGLLMVLRSIPEYVWAFLLLGMLGPNAWPMVLALALHNTGILGRLGAEVVENTETAAPAALRGLGAGRRQIALAGLLPLALGRWLLYFFYRWETCVREATVLGMLGMASLGFAIVESRAHNRYDEMVLHVLLAVLLVVVGDLVSNLARHLLRRA
jgi:phosphonate transport system permease protein